MDDPLKEYFKDVDMDLAWEIAQVLVKLAPKWKDEHILIPVEITKDGINWTPGK